MNGTNDLQLDIDRIVRLVLDDLHVEKEPERRTSPSCPEENSTAIPNVIETNVIYPQEIQIPEKVITVEVVLRYVSEGGRRWILSPGAIVTPAARDELSGHKIELVRGMPCKPTGSREESPEKVQVSGEQFVLAVHATGNESVLPSFSSWLEETVHPRSLRRPCIIEMTGELAGMFAATPELKGIVVTEYPALALLLANRRREFRACYAVGMKQLETEAPLLGANLLVVHAKESPVFLLRQMARWFLDQGQLKEPDFLTPALR